MTIYLYNNERISTNNKKDFLFDEYKQIQKEVENELMNKAKEWSNTSSEQLKDYNKLASIGVRLLQKNIVIAYPESAKPSTTEAFVADTVIKDADRKFHSSSEFGGKLDRILKKLPELTQEKQPEGKPYCFTVDVNF